MFVQVTPGGAMGYRYSFRFIQRWTRRLIWTMCIGIAVAFLLAGGSLLLHDAMGVAEGSTSENVLLVVAIIGLAVGILAVVGCLSVASILGGLSLHRQGWLPGAVLPTWLFGSPFLIFTSELSSTMKMFIYLGGFAPIIAVFYWMGHTARVPMYLTSAAPDSPRLYISEGEGDFTGSGHELDRDRGDINVKDLAAEADRNADSDRDDHPGGRTPPRTG